jgi:excisionase family DNA binding protein
VSPDQVAEIAHVNTSTVLKWAKDGLIRGDQVGPHRKWRFPVAEVRTVLSLYGDGGFELLAMRRGKGRSR